MIEHNELIILLLGLGVLVFIRLNISHLRQVAAFRVLLASYGVVVGGFIFTVLEGIGWEKLFNILEHISYMASILMLLIWCWLVFVRKAKNRQ